MMPQRFEHEKSSDSFDPQTPSSIETRTQEIGQEIFQASRQTIFQKNFWYNKLLELSTSDPRVKTQLFRFVDVLPALQDSASKRFHLIEYLQRPQSAAQWPWSLSLVSSLLKVPVLDEALVRISDFQVAQMAKNFILGSGPEEALPKLLERRSRGMAFTLDILGETVFSDSESQYYLRLYRALISELGDQAKSWKRVPQIDDSALGPIPPVNISLKVSALACHIDPMAFEASITTLQSRIEPLMRLAMEKNVFINFDMEQFALRELTRELFKRILSKPEFRSYRHFGIVVQAYQRTSLADVEDWIQFASERGTPFTIRLVKGAYWDYECIQANQNSWQAPVYLEKRESDANYERCTWALLKAYPKIELAMGSHNVRSLAHGLAVAEHLGLPLNALEIQMLYGMADPFKEALLKRGLRLREYDPVGEMLPGLSYLVRRLLENSANDSFLKQSFMDKTGIRELLKSPSHKGE
jgi:RHH-type proline utilization regulon transcriptional repressor/proline dehydrogenase/delta 1-pyrroline-5-carboxylate dehydrogenase